MDQVYLQSLLEMWYCEQGKILGSERAFRRRQSGTKPGVPRAGEVWDMVEEAGG